MGFLQGKRALITGVASQRSIASGIAEAMHREGAQLAFTYQNEKLKSRVEDAAKEFGSDIVIPLDVADDARNFCTYACVIGDSPGSVSGFALRAFWPPRRSAPSTRYSPAL